MSDPSIPRPPVDFKAIVQETMARFPHASPSELGYLSQQEYNQRTMPADIGAPPRRRPPRPRKPRTRSKQITPYQAKRAAMEDMEIRRLRRDGFTPYFGEGKHFLMTPPEFTLVLACESRQVAQVIHEVLLAFR